MLQGKLLKAVNDDASGVVGQTTLQSISTLAFVLASKVPTVFRIFKYNTNFSGFDLEVTPS